jgi:adenylyltransferase/sulfurtransferase
VLGVMQASEAIKLLLGREGDSPRQTRLVNLLDGSQLTVERSARPDCPVCSRLDQLRAAKPVVATDATLFVNTAGLAALGSTAQTVYLTESGETAPPGRVAVPALDLARLRELAAAGPLALTCRYGVRSAALARLLRAEGADKVFALTQN